MISRLPFHRSRDVKEVIHIKVKKCAGYFNPECKRFAVDPHVTSFSDLQNILIGAFNLTNPFHISYLCRDDHGENVYLALLTEWDLDAAFLTSSDPYLRLKVDDLPLEDGFVDDSRESLTLDKPQHKESSLKVASAALQVSQAWMLSVGKAFTRLTSGMGYNLVIEQNEDDDFFPSMAPLGDQEFHEYLDKTGRLVRAEDLRLRIYHGGVNPSLRKVVWRLLLNIFPVDLTGEQRINYMKSKTKEYYRLCSEWKSRAKEKTVRELSKTIWQDALRTDRNHSYYAGSDTNPHTSCLHNLLLTYALTHKNTRYCQGMSDIASPILFVMDNEAHAYVCFCGIMSRLQDNFSLTGESMAKKFEHLALLLRYHDPEYFEFFKSVGAENMFFCYRWLLLEMKREFSFDDALTVLEVMWSSLPPQNPENDLDLGTIDLEDSKRKSADPKPLEKTGSLPQLCLDAKQLSRSLQCTPSLPNMELPLYTRSSSQIPDSSISHVCEDNTNEMLRARSWVLGAESLSSNENGEDFSVIDDFNYVYSAQSISRGRRPLEALELPPPEELGCGNPFLLFMCLSVLLNQKEEMLSCRRDYDDIVMHFDSLIRRHPPSKVISRAMHLFAIYLRSQTAGSKVDT